MRGHGKREHRIAADKSVFRGYGRETVLRLPSGAGAGAFSLSLLADDNALDDGTFFDTDPDGIDVAAKRPNRLFKWSIQLILQ